MSGAPVITGMGIRTAIGDDLPGFTAALRHGQVFDGSAGLGAQLPDIDFATALAQHTGLGETVLARARRVARRAPLTVRASVLVALQAWEHAGLPREPDRPDEVSIVVAGSNLGGQYAEQMVHRGARGAGLVRPSFAVQQHDSNQIGVLSAVLPIRGEGNTVGAASASGNAAIGQAARAIVAGAARVCVVVGALTELGNTQRAAYLNVGAMAAGRPIAEQCRPFDVDRAGFVPGQGAACVIIEAEEHARSRGARALGTVLGYAGRLDGNHSADPNVAGEADVITAALARAGLAADDVDYVNAHGTGSPLGDDTEAFALAKVFGDRVTVNATKALTGHCLSAAGVVEAVATLVQLRDGFVHANPNLAQPIAPLRFAPPESVDAHLRVAVSTGFGFGGINTCLVLGGRS